jgi:hypothetical protein
MGGNVQYVFCGSAPLLDLTVTIDITETITVSQTSGGVSPPLPVGFQINGIPPTPPNGTTEFIGWQQYGIKMWPGNNTFQSWAQAWSGDGSSSDQLLYTATPPSDDYVTLPSSLTIPAGWTMRFVFQQLGDGTITGFDCSIADGQERRPPRNQNLNLQDYSYSGGTLGAKGMLTPLIAFNVVLVGFYDSADATMSSGAGTITCTSSTPMTPETVWPRGTGQTGENSNSTYDLVRAGTRTSITQGFGVAA